MRQYSTINHSAYQLLIPCEGTTSPLVFSSPHSGEIVPADMLEYISIPPQELKQSQDCMVDQLFKNVAKQGSPLLAAKYSRTYVDLNRHEGEIDATMFEPRPKIYCPNDRTESGLGVIPRIVCFNRDIYTSTLPVDHIKKRLEKAYFPYHAKLKQIISQTKQKYGHAILIDCHSMPSTFSGWNKRNILPDIVLGNCFGKSCGKYLIEAAEKILKGLGFKVQRNSPYAGGYCTEFYGRPHDNLEALQIEINRSLYMDEKSREPNADFSEIKEKINKFSSSLIDYTSVKFTEAAE